MATQPPAVAVDATPEMVAAILRARTKDATGTELGAWTDETRPTLAQVQETIALAQAIVTTQAGAPVAACADMFAVAVCFEAACIIEKGYFPEQIGSGASQYAQLRAETDSLIVGVKDCQQGEGPGGSGVYDVCTPPWGLAGWPVDWWQRDYDDFARWAGTLG